MHLQEEQEEQKKQNNQANKITADFRANRDDSAVINQAVINGDFEMLWGNESTVTNGSIISPILRGVNKIGKIFATPFVGLSWVGHKAFNFVSDKVNAVKESFANISTSTNQIDQISI